MSKALIVGVGGLGCSAAPLLHAAGVDLTLCDFDRIEERNLGRQDLYTAADIGRLKVEAAADRLPGASTVDQPFEARMVSGHDVVLDCTDEPGSRALIHQACLDAKIPLAWAAVGLDIGQTAAVIPGKTACLRCLWSGVGEPTPCDADTDAAVLRITGRAQAAQALDIIAGNAAGGVLSLHGADNRTIRFARNPECPGCRNL